MGQTLSQPITEKHSLSEANENLIYGLSSMQGWRLTMEDAHTAFLQLPNTDKHVAFFAVFDGHGGEKIAQYAGLNLHSKLISLEQFKSGNYKDALKESYFLIDQDLRVVPELKEDSSGATAVSCIITAEEIICANAGDSRCIISRGGLAFPLSNDHKPTLKTESDRIVAAGGFVEFGRVNGNLALSRAIGDFMFKTNSKLPAEAQVVTVEPDITTHSVGDDVLFVVLACDGIWDCMSNQEVVDFIQARIIQGKELTVICEEIIDYCLAPEATLGSVGCDNMSIIIVGLLNGSSKEEWTNRCKSNFQGSPIPQTSSAEELKSPNESPKSSAVPEPKISSVPS